MAMELNQEPKQPPKRSEQKARKFQELSDLFLTGSRAMEQALAAEDGSDTERAFFLLAEEKSVGIRVKLREFS